MTPEALLIPRFKVTAPWPRMELEPFHVGQIVTLTQHETDGYIHIPIKHIPGSYMRKEFFEGFPNLFQPLPWYAEREPGDMPEFVKTWNALKDKYIIRKVGDDSQWSYVPGDNGIEILSGLSIGDDSLILMHYVDPATIEEYEQWKQSINK